MAQHSRWPMPILRIGMGVFLALWGVDKLLANEGGQRHAMTVLYACLTPYQRTRTFRLKFIKA